MGVVEGAKDKLAADVFDGKEKARRRAIIGVGQVGGNGERIGERKKGK